MTSKYSRLILRQPVQVGGTLYRLDLQKIGVGSFQMTSRFSYYQTLDNNLGEFSVLDLFPRFGLQVTQWRKFNSVVIGALYRRHARSHERLLCGAYRLVSDLQCKYTIPTPARSSHFVHCQGSACSLCIPCHQQSRPFFSDHVEADNRLW